MLTTYFGAGQLSPRVLESIGVPARAGIPSLRAVSDRTWQIGLIRHPISLEREVEGMDQLQGAKEAVTFHRSLALPPHHVLDAAAINFWRIRGEGTGKRLDGAPIRN